MPCYDFKDGKEKEILNVGPMVLSVLFCFFLHCFIFNLKKYLQLMVEISHILTRLPCAGPKSVTYTPTVHVNQTVSIHISFWSFPTRVSRVDNYTPGPGWSKAVNNLTQDYTLSEALLIISCLKMFFTSNVWCNLRLHVVHWRANNIKTDYLTKELQIK